MTQKLQSKIKYVPKLIIAGVLLLILILMAVPQLTSSKVSGKENLPNSHQNSIAENQMATATPTIPATHIPAETPSATSTQISNVSMSPIQRATAEYQSALATANIQINGEPSASPPVLPPFVADFVMPADMVLVTATPTPKNIITVAAQAKTATTIATVVGTYTPEPSNWVVPEIIIPPTQTQVPANSSTAVHQAAEATAAAFVYGTPTPIPAYVWTATPTPFMRPVTGDVATPWIAPTPTATPLPIPQKLVGKIIFLSNRSGGKTPLESPLAYATNSDGSHLAVLADDTFYKTALMRDTFPADQQSRVFVKDVNGAPAIFLFDYSNKSTLQLTSFPAGHGAWDPVLSPAGDRVAFVSNASGDDEIWIVNRNGSGLKRLTATNTAYNAREIGKDTFLPEVNGHPSWSPDGTKILFWSNRTGHRQLWLINADGTNEQRLVTNAFDDWDPIWVKYADAPRQPVFGIGAD